MALIGYGNKVTTDILVRLLSNETIAKLLYYDNVLDIDVEELEMPENIIGKLTKKVFINRRLEVLQKSASVGMTISIFSKEAWEEYGKTYDTSIKNIIEVGVACHEECEETINGSRTYALIDTVIKELSRFNIQGLGKIKFMNMYRTKDLPIEYNGYLMYFEIFNLKETL